MEIEKAKNIGPIVGAELRSIGIDTVEELIRLGWEEAFLKLIEAYPERLNLNCAAAFIGAVEGIDFRKVLPNQKAAARKLIQSLKNKSF